MAITKIEFDKKIKELSSLVLKGNDNLEKKIDTLESNQCILKMSLEGELTEVNTSIKKQFSSLKRKIEEIESNQRSYQAIQRDVIRGNGRSIEKAPYELRGHGFVEEINDYY